MKRLNVVAVAAFMAGGLLSASVHATTLLNLVNAPAGTTDYSLSFTATADTTSLSVGGYQILHTEYVTHNSVSAGAGPNLLGGSWVFTPAAEGTFALASYDGTSVPGLTFGGDEVGYYDVFSQTFATVIGTTYTYRFHFVEGLDANGLEVTTTGSAVPEIAPWAMILVGFGSLGGMMRWRRRTDVTA